MTIKAYREGGEGVTSTAPILRLIDRYPIGFRSLSLARWMSVIHFSNQSVDSVLRVRVKAGGNAGNRKRARSTGTASYRAYRC